MNALLIAHLADGLVAILTGALAIPPRKGLGPEKPPKPSA